MKTEFYKKLIPIEGLTKKGWLEYRQKGIGGSDIASACGVNPWKSGLALWQEKTMKIGEEEEENIPAELGIYLEPFLKKKFEKWIKMNEGIDIEVLTMPYILQHPTNKIALANIDGLFDNPYDTCLVEYKTTSERNYKQWEKDQLPDYYYLQTQWYLYVTNYQFCYLAFLVGNRRFDVKLIKRNDEVIGQLVKKSDYFWNTFVVPKIPPAPDGTESSARALTSLYPKEEEGKVITIEGEDYLQCLRNLEQLKVSEKEAKLGIEECKQMFKAKMGNAEIAICGDKKITWKEMIRKEYIVKESKFRSFRISNNKEVKE